MGYRTRSWAFREEGGTRMHFPCSSSRALVASSTVGNSTHHSDRVLLCAFQVVHAEITSRSPFSNYEEVRGKTH